MESERVCIPIQFMKRPQEYCEIELNNLTRESFILNVDSIVPSKISTSSKLELTVCDDKNVVIPFHLAAQVIRTHMKRDGFCLKVILGSKIHIEDEVSMTKELRKFLIKNHLKHIVVKGENNEIDFNRFERDLLIRAASDLITNTHGPKPLLADRKMLAQSIHTLFPRFDYELALYKLNTRLKNGRRPPQSKKPRHKTEIQVTNENIASNNHLQTNSIDISDLHQNTEDYEEILDSFNLPTKSHNSKADDYDDDVYFQHSN